MYRNERQFTQNKDALSPCFFNTRFSLFCVSQQRMALSLPTALFVFQNDRRGFFLCNLLSENTVFSGDCFFCQISSGNQVNCFHEQILEDKDWILLFFHVPVSLMSLAGRSVDVALILCNLDITLCKTALDFGVLWNQITSSPAFLSPSLWSVKYPLIWQCWSAAALPDGSGQQAAHESSRCFTCLGQWKPYGPFFLHLLPGANVSTADIWMFAMQEQRQEKAAELCWAWCCITIVVFFQSSLRGLFTNVMLLTCS